MIKHRVIKLALFGSQVLVLVYVHFYPYSSSSSSSSSISRKVNIHELFGLAPKKSQINSSIKFEFYPLIIHKFKLNGSVETNQQPPFKAFYQDPFLCQGLGTPYRHARAQREA